jgi:hypothetical protein
LLPLPAPGHCRASASVRAAGLARALPPKATRASQHWRGARGRCHARVPATSGLCHRRSHLGKAIFLFSTRIANNAGEHRLSSKVVTSPTHSFNFPFCLLRHSVDRDTFVPRSPFPISSKSPSATHPIPSPASSIRLCRSNSHRRSLPRHDGTTAVNAPLLAPVGGVDLAGVLLRRNMHC